ncbi:HAMP domain-containing sensor histidine kinase [Pseudomonas sp. CHM02]|uniref:sensor histidine kinase n=1 Tax=Pseudomonas sp. CHM02 TaxID=1463662 RepID=UPI000470F74C|nr:ATP-binding protein [Pseudomonas sp. CHM02]
MKASPLWLWVGLRMTLLAVGTVITITCCVYFYFWLTEYQTQQSMTPDDRSEYVSALADVQHNEARLWDIVQRYYDIGDFISGASNHSSWWVVFIFSVIVIPITIIIGLLLSKPLSGQFSKIAEAARKVTNGDLAVRVVVNKRQPTEMQALSENFNSMVEKLSLYEKEVKESSSNLAHELRTPLNAALGRVQGMLDDVFPQSAEQLKLVQDQLQNLNALVGDLHLLSLVHAGEFKIHAAPLSLNRLIKERLAWFSPQFKKNEMAVITALEFTESIEGDRGRLGQLVNILIENAIKYASEGRALVVSTYGEGGMACLAFLDKGQAVDENDLRNMFTRFWRAEQSRARLTGGGGLGLSIAQAICEAHGGKILAMRRPAGGLALKVCLPLRPPALNCYSPR